MPRLRLRAGRTYTLSFHAGCGISGYAERIAVGFGQGDNPKAYSTIVEPTLFIHHRYPLQDTGHGRQRRRLSLPLPMHLAMPTATSFR